MGSWQELLINSRECSFRLHHMQLTNHPNAQRATAAVCIDTSFHCCRGLSSLSHFFAASGHRCVLYIFFFFFFPGNYEQGWGPAEKTQAVSGSVAEASPCGWCFSQSEKYIGLCWHFYVFHSVEGTVRWTCIYLEWHHYMCGIGSICLVISNACPAVQVVRYLQWSSASCF